MCSELLRSGIDKYENKVPCGRIYNKYLDSGIAFQSTIELLMSMDTMLEEMNWPQSFSNRRVFWPTEEREIPEKVSAETREGEMATFAVRVLFRQNASWQGTITWYEGKREESFRSVLELLYLIDSALGAAKSGKKEEV